MTWLIGIAILAVVAAAFPAVVAAAIMWVGGLFIGIAAKLLDVSLYALVAKFDTVIYSSLAPAINELWASFRDIANILIIGMFTFIAISMILGVQKFNAKKMVANVLIIAVLINFSLLFTRMIISSSNFVAAKFYCSMMVNAGQSQVCSPGATPPSGLLTAIGSASSGVGLRFMEFLGAPSFWESWNSTRRVYDANATWWAPGVGGGFFALIYGMSGAALMIAASLVFMYIAFLVVARSILFLFLLVTSAPAFAAYLVPKHGEKYWGMWWSSLLRSALFGPVLVMMLWATFKISERLVATVGRGRSFDALFTNEASGSGYLALLTFAIVLGMLYASARFANSFSKSIQGFDWGTMAAGIPLALGGGLAGMLGRGIAGRIFAARGAKAGERAGEMNRLIAKTPNTPAYAQRLSTLNAGLRKYEAQKNFAEKMAGKKFTLPGQASSFLKDAGVPEKLIGGKNVASFADWQKKTVKEAVERASSANKFDAAAARTAATKSLEMQREGLQLQKKTLLETKVRDEAIARKAEINAIKTRESTAEKDLKTAEGSTHGPKRDTDMDFQKNRIEEARKDMAELIAQMHKNAGIDALDEQLEELGKKIETVGEEAEKAGKKMSNEAGAKLAQSIAYGRNTNILPLASRGNPDNDRTANLAREGYYKKVGASPEDRLLDALRGITPPKP